jgi:hypothetical protein
MTERGEYVFPAVASFRRCMSNNTMNAALRRLGYTKEEVSVSGFRATASTLFNEMGSWNPDAIERQLAGAEKNDVRRAYTRAAEFWNERVEMMQVSADYLDQLRHGSSTDQGVQSFARAQRRSTECRFAKGDLSRAALGHAVPFVLLRLGVSTRSRAESRSSSDIFTP